MAIVAAVVVVVAVVVVDAMGACVAAAGLDMLALADRMVLLVVHIVDMVAVVHTRDALADR